MKIKARSAAGNTQSALLLESSARTGHICSSTLVLSSVCLWRLILKSGKCNSPLSWFVPEMLSTLLCLESPLWYKCSYIVPFSEKVFQYTLKVGSGARARRDVIPTIGNVAETGLVSYCWTFRSLVASWVSFSIWTKYLPDQSHFHTYLLEYLTKMYNLVIRYWGQKLKS